MSNELLKSEMVSQMTKRELIATAAMQGLCVAHDSEGEWSHDATLIARRSVAYADALLAELAKDATP